MLLTSALFALAKVYLVILVVTCACVVSNEREKFYAMTGVHELYRDIPVGERTLADAFPVTTFIMSMMHHVTKSFVALAKYTMRQAMCSTADGFLSFFSIDIGCSDPIDL